MEIFLRWLISGVLFILIANFASAAPPNWKTTKIEEREFVALNEVAAALGMKRSEKRADPLEIGFESDAHSLIVKLGSRQAIIDGVRHWFSFPIPKEEGKKGRLYISLIDLKSTVIPALTLKIEGLGPVKTVVFDPGHGGHDPGAIGAFGKEKDYALDIVKRTRRILEGRGIKVVQSRLSDFYVKLSDRPAMTKNYDDPIFVSIHLNGSTNRNASGFEIFAFTPSGAPATGRAPSPKGDAEIESATPNEPSSFLLANVVYQHLIGKVEAFDRGVKRARFSVLRTAKVPAILIEGGFLTNRAEIKRINTAEWRESYATALADGIMAYIKLANEKTSAKRSIDLGRKPTDEFVPE